MTLQGLFSGLVAKPVVERRKLGDTVCALLQLLEAVN